ncbi:MAG: type II toxin-antitoxin system VapB family antitoxin [Coriobacteriia bacterium]|nr:type II toxin-antitoxin system VapB family antitoxin [Coriobacteriia bacterium]
MMTAKLFQNGKSQAVRLPKEYRFARDEVCIRKVGDLVVLFPQDRAWDIFMQGIDTFTDDCPCNAFCTTQYRAVR